MFTQSTWSRTNYVHSLTCKPTILIPCATEQVETLLKTQEPPELSEQQQKSPSPTTTVSYPTFPTEPAPPPTSTNFIIESNLNSMNDYTLPTGTPMGGISTEYGFDQPALPTENADTYPWEMIGLGLDEPLPPQETIDDLYIPSINMSKVYSALIETTDINYTLRKSILLLLSCTVHASSPR